MKLRNISDMSSRFHYPIGLSDHSMGSLGAVVATALGACVIEKHVKIDGVNGADDAFSMTMEEYKMMVSDVLNAKKMLTGPDYNLTEGERKSLQFRRSLFAVDNISKGDVFTKENVRSIRPSNGISPKYLSELLGKECNRDIKRGEPIIMDDLI